MPLKHPFNSHFYLLFLYQGKTFWLTPTIEPSWKKLKLVIESAGGKLEQTRRWDLEKIREANDNPKSPPTYIIITCEHDLHLVMDVLKAELPIFSTDFVTRGVLEGVLDFDLRNYITTVH